MVTGSCCWLQGKTNGLVVDMGMFQGLDSKELNANWPKIETNRIAGVFVTHAHLDHGGRLPLLIKMGYRGKFYMTAATRDLLELSLFDAVKIRKEDRRESLFGEKEVKQLFNRVEFLEIGEEKILGEFEVGFLRAGHILGAVSIRIRSRNESGKTVVFSGDVGSGESPLIKPPEPVGEAETVVMESTYGNRLHEKEDEKRILKDEIETVVRLNGVLLVPVFSIQRSQRVLHILDHIQREGGLAKGTKVYFDSPMAIEATKIFGKYRRYYSDELNKHVGSDDPFGFPGLVVTRRAKESRLIKKNKRAKIIIAGSGMMTGGRIMGHAKEYLPRPNTRLLLVGYQAIGTLGRQIADGAKRVSIDNETIEVNAGVRQIYSMSAHADQKQLLDWLGKIAGVKKVILTHGEDEAREVLAGLISGVEILKPKLGEEIVV